MPTVWIKPTTEVPKPSEYIYNCPLYKTVDRSGDLDSTGHSTNYILDLKMPTSEPKDKWTKAGVAAVLSLKYE